MGIINLTLCAETTSSPIFLTGYCVVWAFIVGHGEIELTGTGLFFGNIAGGVGGSGIALMEKSGHEKYMRTFMRRMMVLVTGLLKNEQGGRQHVIDENKPDSTKCIRPQTAMMIDVKKAVRCYCGRRATQMVCSPPLPLTRALTVFTCTSNPPLWSRRLKVLSGAADHTVMIPCGRKAL
jgi:hypothetical protein